jgi:hypothetical protein
MVTAKTGGRAHWRGRSEKKSGWFRNGKKIPAERVIAVEHVTGIPREKPRSDIFAISKGVLTLVEVKGPRPAGRKKR